MKAIEKFVYYVFLVECVLAAGLAIFYDNIIYKMFFVILTLLLWMCAVLMRIATKI